MRSLVILILISVAVSCSQNEEEVEEIPPQFIEIQQIADSLTLAYNENSVQKLNSFLDYWNIITHPYKVESINNDTIRSVYEIYMTLYNPFDISEMTQNEAEVSIYSNLSYIVIQNKVYFDFNYEGNEASELDSIVDFRPPVQFSKAKIIYFTRELKEALNIFLGNTPLMTNYNNTEVINYSTFEVEEKIDFLRQSLEIISSHWGGYWYIETHPKITSVHFNQGLSMARINFNFGFIVGEVIMDRVTGTWTVTGSSFHIIE